MKLALRGAVVVPAFNPSTWGGRGRWISEFKVILVYRVSSRTARAIQRNPVSKKQKQKQTNNIYICICKINIHKQEKKFTNVKDNFFFRGCGGIRDRVSV